MLGCGAEDVSRNAKSGAFDPDIINIKYCNVK